MSKYIAIPGLCSTHNRQIGFQFEQDNDLYIAVGSFSMTGGSASGSDTVNGRFVQSPAFSCRYCGNKSVFSCTNCHTFFCIKLGAERVTCPKCKANLSIKWVNDLDLVDKSSADVNKQ